MTFLATLVNEDKFLKLIKHIIAVFEIDLDLPFVGNFNEDAECNWGDISDVMLEVTFELYPIKSLEIDKVIGY